MQNVKDGATGTVGYLGPAGTHSEEALLRLYQGRKQDFVPYPRIDLVIRAVDRGEVSTGIVPIENSIEGAVNITLDTLVHEVDLWIAGEVIWPVRHHLLVKPGNQCIQTIVSHPQALAQCRKFIAAHYPAAILSMVESTAQAANLAAGGDGTIAAIGSLAAARAYGLEAMAAGIQDQPNNCTRFVLIQKKPAIASEPKRKTSIVFQINGEKPGSLYNILAEFALRGVNLTRIESRPARTGLGNYVFFVDLDGSPEDIAVEEAISAVRMSSLWFKNLGSYPVLLNLEKEE